MSPPLDEDPKGNVDVERTSLAVAEKLFFDGNLGLTVSATMLANDVLQLNSVRFEDRK